MASQAQEAEIQTADLPPSPQSQTVDSETDSVPDLVITNPQANQPEEADNSRDSESSDPPPAKKVKLRRAKATAHAELSQIRHAVSNPCPCAMVLGTGGNMGKRHLINNTKEKCRVQILKVRVNRKFWDGQIEGYKFAYEMKANKKERPDNGLPDITKFRRFMRAIERKWLCWGAQWLENANQTLSKEDSRPDVRACLSHVFPDAPGYLYATFQFFCEYFIGQTITYHQFHVADLQCHIMAFCPGVYYIVHYCMALGIPSLMIALYLLDAFLGKDVYVTIQEIEFVLDMITKTDVLPNYCDWCFNPQLMVGHFIEPVEAYSVIFRVVDVISLGLGMDSNLVIPRGMRKTVQCKLEYPTFPIMNKSCSPTYDRMCTPFVSCTVCSADNTIQACFEKMELRHLIDGGGVKVTKYNGCDGKAGGLLMTAKQLFVKQQYHQFLGDELKLTNMDNTDMVQITPAPRPPSYYGLQLTRQT